MGATQMKFNQQRRQISRIPGWRASLLATATSVVLGCGGTDPSDGDVDTVNAALTSCTAPACKEFTDSTGTMKVRVRTCPWVSATGSNGSQTAVATCAVDTDAGYALVGGGAEVEGSSVPGALLKEDRPDPFFGTAYTRWRVQSSQFTTSSGAAHRVRAYSIGLRLVGMSYSDLQANLVWQDNTSDASTRPFTFAPGPLASPIDLDLQLPIGGGAAVLPETEPLFLAGSMMRDWTYDWIAEAGSNGNGRTASVKAYILTITRCPVRFSNNTTWGCLGGVNSWHDKSGSGGYVSSSAFENTGTSRLVTSVGGWTWSDTSANRFMTDIIPAFMQGTTQLQGVQATSKNTNVVAGGTVEASLDEIVKL